MTINTQEVPLFHFKQILIRKFNVDHQKREKQSTSFRFSNERPERALLENVI